MNGAPHVSHLPPTERRDQGHNRRAGRPQRAPSPKCDMWGNICSAINIAVITHCLLKWGFGRVRGKHFHLRDTWPVFAPQVSVRRRGACSCHSGSLLFTGPSSSEKSRGRFSAGGHKSQAGEQQVWGQEGTEEEDVGGIGNPEIIARRKGKKINGEAKVKGHQRCTVKWGKYSCFHFSLPKKSFISIIMTVAFSEESWWINNKQLKPLKSGFTWLNPAQRPEGIYNSC